MFPREKSSQIKGKIWIDHWEQQVVQPIYITRILKSIKADSLQIDTNLELMVHPHTFPSVLNASAPDWMTTLHLCMQGPDWNMESCYGTTCRQIAGYLCACTQLEGYGASCEWISMLEPWSYQVRNFWARCWSARAWQPFAMLLSLGGEGWKTLSVGHCFQVFWQFKEKHWPN